MGTTRRLMASARRVAKMEAAPMTRRYSVIVNQGSRAIIVLATPPGKMPFEVSVSRPMTPRSVYPPVTQRDC